MNYLNRLRRKTMDNYLCRQVLSFICPLGAVGYIGFCLVTGRVDPMMEGVAFIAILFGLVSVGKQYQPLLHAIREKKDLEKELRSSPTDRG